jgi:hypothetical protein
MCARGLRFSYSNFYFILFLLCDELPGNLEQTTQIVGYFSRADETGGIEKFI